MKLIEYRRSRGLTQPELAEMIGCKTSAVSRYENGRTPEPVTIKRIAAVTQGAVTPNDFHGVP